jgi:hypothetical protein
MSEAIDFLGIGAQKAGTSWLYAVLRQHPQVWMPPIKELHYFSRSSQYPSISRLAQIYFIQRVREDKTYLRKMMGALWSRMRIGDWTTARFYLTYYTGTYDDSWYLSLFKFGASKIKGEITPAYSMLNAEDVRHVHNLLPNLKIILLLRNPIERAWSNYRFSMDKRGNVLGADSIDDMKKFMNEPGQELRSDYLRTINNWSASFPLEQMYIGFYDDLLRDPRVMIRGVCDFLGIDAECVSTKSVVDKHFNVSKKLDIPTEIQYYLAEKYHKDIQALHTMLGGPTETWLQEAEMILQHTTS